MSQEENAVSAAVEENEAVETENTATPVENADEPSEGGNLD